MLISSRRVGRPSAPRIRTSTTSPYRTTELNVRNPTMSPIRTVLIINVNVTTSRCSRQVPRSRCTGRFYLHRYDVRHAPTRFPAANPVPDRQPWVDLRELMGAARPRPRGHYRQNAERSRWLPPAGTRAHLAGIRGKCGLIEVAPARGTRAHQSRGLDTSFQHCGSRRCFARL